jgi:hypothetical protein
MASALVGGVSRQISRRKGTRANQAHIASNNVPKLWEFINAAPAEEPAAFTEPDFITEQRASLIDNRSHCSEFQDFERAVAVADAGLTEEGRRAEAYADDRGGHSDNGGQ